MTDRTLQSQLKVAIIADDLTGAMDAASPFARRGLEVEVVANIDQLDSLLSSCPEVLSVNTNTRHASTQDAAAVVKQVVDTLTRLKPDILFKKVDSTLRGNVVAESVAAYQACGMPSTVFCPAIPAQGRTFVQGCVYIDDVALKDTAIGQDLRSAPSAVTVPELFYQSEISTHIRHLDVSQYDDIAADQFHIIDARCQQDLTDIAQQCLSINRQIMFVGAAGLTEALADLLFGPVQHREVGEVLNNSAAFVVGSRTPEVKNQIEKLMDQYPDCQYMPVVDATPLAQLELSKFSKLKTPETFVLHACQSVAEQSLDPDRVSSAMAESTMALLKTVPIDLLVVTGGDTAMAVLNQFSVSSIRVMGEVQPGIVYGRVKLGDKFVWVVTKAGGFGAPSLFHQVLKFWYA